MKSELYCKAKSTHPSTLRKNSEEITVLQCYKKASAVANFWKEITLQQVEQGYGGRQTKG